MKRKAISIGLMLALCALQVQLSFGADVMPAKKIIETKNKTVFAYLRSDVKVKMDDKLYIFYDASASRVYPLFYAGTAYLPVRAISSMLDKNIDWEDSNRTVYIGRTLKDPDTDRKKEQQGEIPYAVGVAPSNYIAENTQMRQVNMQIRGDVRILYNFEEKQLVDANDAKVYPAIYNGGTYLPIRAVSKLLDKKIDWDQVENTIVIGDNEKKDAEPSKDPKDEKAEQEKKNALFKKTAQADLRELDVLNKQATDNLVALRKEENAEKRLIYAEAISQTCKAIELKKGSLGASKEEKPTEAQKAVIEALSDYAQMLWHYSLIMENISYLAAADQDFSMLSETFLNFALLTQQKQQLATNLLEGFK